MPQIRLEPGGGRMGVTHASRDTLNFAQPELSLLGMTLDIVEQPLLGAVKAHAANLPRQGGKTTANPRPSDYCISVTPCY